MDILFLKVLRDVYIRSIIFKHLRIYNENIYKIFRNFRELKEYPQKYYIINLIIIEDDTVDFFYDTYTILSSLYIESLTFKNTEIRINFEYLPETLKELTLGKNYCYPIQSNEIPKSLKKIQFGYNWNQRINLNKTNIETIIFGNNFNQKLKAGNLPYSLKEITFGYYYSQPLEIGCIPENVEKITFGYCFDFPLNGVIPNSCKILNLGGKFNYKLDFVPNGVEEIYFSTYWNQQLKPFDLPSSLKKIKFNFHFNKKLLIGSIPSSVTHLTFGNSFNNDNSKLNVGAIPFGVTHLEFGDSFNIQLLKGSIPDSVTFLKFGSKFLNKNKSLKNVLPKNLLHLEFLNHNFQFPENEKPPNCNLKTNYRSTPKPPKITFLKILGHSVLFLALITRAVYETVIGWFV
ncbi:hypothetical protein ACTA71_010362 [Dictyostelium dimigraforme]